MATIDELVIELSADVKELKKSLGAAEKHVNDYEKSINVANKKVDSSFKSAGASIKSVIGPLLAATAAYSAMDKLISEGRSFAIMSAQLQTATGSAESAAKEFAKLEQFAAETPFLLQQSIDAFTKLTNLGLTPSEAAMMSYGNTAAAMGKDLNQMIEAVADAATGEFERLKEFGIKSKSQGDQVSFTFRGITTTVGKNAAEIEGYLMALGENEFAGAMAKRMATLDGAISNLQDTWDALFRNILASGVGNLIEDGFRGATDALNYFMEVTGIAKEAPIVYNETADAAINLSKAQERLGSLAESSAGKEEKLLSVIRNIEAARDKQIAQTSQNITDERALASIREGFSKKYELQINAVKEAYVNSSQINSELRQKEITEIKQHQAVIDEYVKKQQEQFVEPPKDVKVEFAEDIGATSFEARIEMLQEHHAQVWQVIQDHNRLVKEDEAAQAQEQVDIHKAGLEQMAKEEKANARKRAATQKALARTTLSSARSTGDHLTEVMRRSGQEQSAVAKAIFLAQKGIDVATIISSTEVAAAKASAVAAAGGPLSFFATAKSIRAFGYANAALVAGLGVHSALGGGGGGSGGGGGGGITSPTGGTVDNFQAQTGTASGSSVTVNIHGNFYGDESLQELMRETIVSAVNDNQVNFDTTGDRLRAIP